MKLTVDQAREAQRLVESGEAHDAMVAESRMEHGGTWSEAQGETLLFARLQLEAAISEALAGAGA